MTKRDAKAPRKRKTVAAKRSAKVGWGLVTITGGPYAGRIGIYDDDDLETDLAIVYFGDMDYVTHYFFIEREYLAEVTTSDLLSRREAIDREIAYPSSKVGLRHAIRAERLAELLIIDNALASRMIVARTTETTTHKQVFISHSSKDKQFAKWVAVDLANAGHSAWLDEWKIRVGESIPTRVAQGIDECDPLIVVLSEHAVVSHWVEREWQAKYWDEVKDGRVRVLPVLLQQCELPTLLRTKRYANFVDGYNRGLEELLAALK